MEVLILMPTPKSSLPRCLSLDWKRGREEDGDAADAHRGDDVDMLEKTKRWADIGEDSEPSTVCFHCGVKCSTRARLIEHAFV